MNYYNEFDPFASKWLKQLIKNGCIPEGVVDDRSIIDVEPSDLKGFTQCHFFSGIGGWSQALKLAGWSETRPVWTGSPPCQPFSQAGNQKGKDDDRHLWPHFFELIKACRPDTVFGEQVATAIKHEWFDDLKRDLQNVYPGINRESLYGMQGIKTIDRVSEVLWSGKRGYSTSLQDLPKGLREELEIEIQRIQEETERETQREGQNISQGISSEISGKVSDSSNPQKMQGERDTVRSGYACRQNSDDDRCRGMPSEWSPSQFTSQDWKMLQRAINRQNKSEEGVRPFKHTDCGTCSEYSDGGLGGEGLFENSEGLVEEISRLINQELPEHGYEVAMSVLPAASVGSPHKRDRLFFVASRNNYELTRKNEQRVNELIKKGHFDLQNKPTKFDYAKESQLSEASSVNAPHKRDRLFYVGDSIDQRLQGYGESGQILSEERWEDTVGHSTETGVDSSTMADTVSNEYFGEITRCDKEASGVSNIDWKKISLSWELGRASEIILCRDDKYRVIPTQRDFQSMFPDGLSIDMDDFGNASEEQIALLLGGYPLTTLKLKNNANILKGAGNAIVPQVAAEFIKAFMSVEEHYCE